MNTFIIIILFYLFISFISFVSIYMNDKVDTAEDDFKYFEPSISDLSEEERKDRITVDNYIKNTICPRYHYQILRKEIDNYQKNDDVPLAAIAIIFMSFIPLKIFGIGLGRWWWFFTYILFLIIGGICHFVVWKIYRRKYSTFRIRQYYENHPSYDWESHYDYLYLNKGTVVFRHVLRRTSWFLSLLCFGIPYFITH